MYRGLNVTWIAFLIELAYSGVVFGLGILVGRLTLTGF